MAVQAKVVFFFNYFRWGWTETYYYNGATGNLRDALNQAKILASARKKLLSTTTGLEAIRATDMGTKESSYLIFPDKTSGDTSGLSGEQPWEALLGTVYAQDTANNTYRRSLLLRGLPEEWNGFVGATTINSVFSTAFLRAWNPFVQILNGNSNTVNQGWSIRAATKNNPLNAPQAITGIAIDPVQKFYIVTVAPGGPVYTLGQTIHVGKVKGVGIAGLVGDHVVIQVPEANSYGLNVAQKYTFIPPLLTNPGVIYAVNKTLLQIRTVDPDRFVKRDTGRAFFVTRGRARKRV